MGQRGSQSDKSVTDVGAGAGAQSRAADTHLILRDHAKDNAVILEAAARSWPPVKPTCLRWEYPIWRLADDLDPLDLRKPGQRRREEEEPEVVWTVSRFAGQFITAEPKVEAVILCEAEEAGIKTHNAKKFLAAAVGKKVCHRWEGKDRRAPVRYSLNPQPVTDTGDSI